MGQIMQLHSVGGPNRHSGALKALSDAVAIVMASGVIITGTLIGGLWLLAQAAAWIAHALPTH